MICDGPPISEATVPVGGCDLRPPIELKCSSLDCTIANQPSGDCSWSGFLSCCYMFSRSLSLVSKKYCLLIQQNTRSTPSVILHNDGCYEKERRTTTEWQRWHHLIHRRIRIALTGCRVSSLSLSQNVSALLIPAPFSHFHDSTTITKESGALAMLGLANS